MTFTELASMARDKNLCSSAVLVLAHLREKGVTTLTEADCAASSKLAREIIFLFKYAAATAVSCLSTILKNLELLTA